MEQKKQLSFLNYLAILAVFLFSGAGTFMNAAIHTMIEAWPELPVSTIRMVVSLPPLISLPVMLLIGVVVGKKVSYRLCAILGTLLIAVGGVAPHFFYSNWTLVLLFRAILGVGVGFLGMRNPLIVKSLPADKQAAYIGYGQVVMNIGSVLANPIVGALTRYSWHHPFLYDAIAFIPVVILLLFLREPEKETAKESVVEQQVKAAPAEKGKFTWRIYFYMVLQFATTAVLYPLLSGLTTYMADKEIGSAVLAGTMLSAYTLAGALANLVLNPLMKVLKQYTMGVMCALVVAGTALILFVPSVPTLFIGVMMAGLGFCVNISVFQVYNGRISHPSVMASASTIILAMMQLGIFASTYFITICDGIFHRATDVESSYLGCLICYAVMAILSFVLRVAPEEDYGRK